MDVLSLINGVSRAVDLNYCTHEEAVAIARKSLGLHGNVKPESGIAQPEAPAPEAPTEQPAETQPEATPEQPAQ